MSGTTLVDPANTQVTTLQLQNNAELSAQIADKCASAAAIGYRLAACFPHDQTGRLVLVFQKPLPSA